MFKSVHSSFPAPPTEVPQAELFSKENCMPCGEGRSDVNTWDWHAEEVPVGRKYVQTWCFMTRRHHSSHRQPTLSGKTILPDVLNVTDKRAFLFLKDHFLTQGFWLSMHLQRKTTNHTWERHQWQHLPLAQGIREVKEGKTEIANPFPS